MNGCEKAQEAQESASLPAIPTGRVWIDGVKRLLYRKAPAALRWAQVIRTLPSSAYGRLSLAALREGEPLRIVIGASGRFDRGWIPTEAHWLNLLREEHWSRLFRPGSIDCLLAEHVWEHLTAEEAARGAAICHRYLRAGGCLRVAVPDGWHPAPEYARRVRPGGCGLEAYDHKQLYTAESLSEQFQSAGFQVALLEHFDKAGVFHRRPWDAGRGLIRRSFANDPQNRDGRLRYTSIIADCEQPGES